MTGEFVMRKSSLYTGLLMIISATPAQAYIGPGAGAGTIAVVLGVLASIFFAFVAILWYPLKRLIKGLKTKTEKPAEE
jgi:preprotein translocase subunit SecF